MRCPNCDHELTEGTVICPRCGVSVREKPPLLIQQPIPSFSDARESSGHMQLVVRIWAVLAFLLGIVGTLYLAFHYGYTEEVYTYLGKIYSTGSKIIVHEIFWPALIGGLFLSGGNCIFLLSVADALEKLGDIRRNLSVRR